MPSTRLAQSSHCLGGENVAIAMLPPRTVKQFKSEGARISHLRKCRYARSAIESRSRARVRSGSWFARELDGDHPETPQFHPARNAKERSVFDQAFRR